METEILKLDRERQEALVRVILADSTFLFSVKLAERIAFKAHGIDTVIDKRFFVVNRLPIAIRETLNTTLPDDPSFPLQVDLEESINEALLNAQS